MKADTEILMLQMKKQQALRIKGPPLRYEAGGLALLPGLSAMASLSMEPGLADKHEHDLGVTIQDH